jgi:hypothetical protein
MPRFMELLLNLAWLLLVLPAYCLWRGSRTASSERKFSSLQALLALGCALVLLFPVISATDDLHAMRAEIEESPCSKRSVRQVSTDKASGWHVRLQTPPAAVENFRIFAPGFERANVAVSPNFSLSTEPAVLRAGRAPPAARLA